MQKRVHAQVGLRGRRRLESTLLVMALALLLPALVFAGEPTVTNLNVTFVDFLTARLTAEVTTNGGNPPIFDRGFVYSPTPFNSDPFLGGPSVNSIFVPGTIGPMNRTFAVIPGATYSVKAYAINPVGTAYTGVQTYTAPCPAMALPLGLPPGALNTLYGYQVVAMGTFGLDVYDVSFGSLPLGLTLDPGGNLSGTPSAPGNYNFTIRVIDQFYGCTNSQAYSMDITAVDVNPRKLDFPSEVVGGPGSPAKTVTITNNSVAAVALGSILSDSPNFAATNACPGTLNPGASCTVSVVFSPPSQAVHLGKLFIGAIEVGMRGAGTTAAVAQVYASNVNGGSVSVIDPVTNLVRTVVGVGSEPRNLAVLPGGARVYVPNRLDPSVSVIRTSDNTVIATITDPGFGEPYAVAPTPLGDEVWVADKTGTFISIINTTTNTVVGTADGELCISGPEAIVANPRTHEMYVISRNNSRVCVFDRVTRLHTRTINIGGDPRYGVVLPDGSALYVSGASGADRVALPSGAVTSIPGAAGENMDVSADGSKIYIAQQGNGLGVIKTATNTFTTISLTGVDWAFGVAVHDASGRVYVTDQNQHVAYVVDLASDVQLPDPQLPIQDPGFSTPGPIATVKSLLPPVGGPPTVGGLGAVPASGAASVSATVDTDGGVPPIFERGFAYSLSDTTPQPGEPTVSVAVVPGGIGAMNAMLTNLFPGSTYYYQAYAKNLVGTGLSGPLTFSTSTCSIIGIDPTAMPSGSVGSPYSLTFTATGGAGPYAFTYTGLPPGLAGAGGVVSGTPTTGGAYDVEVFATETPTGCSASNRFQLIIGTPVSAGSAVISEFRARGPNGAYDEYVEIGNRTAADIVVLDPDGSGGWSIGRPGEVLAIIPDGTVIPKGGHWLATGVDFSLGSFGVPDPVGYGDLQMSGFEIPDDAGFGLFTSTDPGKYALGTRLDAVGGVAETDPLFWEGQPLDAVVQDGPANPVAQTAWVRRTGNNGILVDGGDNTRDFVFVAGDAGTAYGPTAAPVAAVLGGPSPEGSFGAVHDVLQAEFTAALLDPSINENLYPNREKDLGSAATWIEYRRVFTNNTGREITALTFKVLNLTTIHSRRTLAVQSELGVVDAPSRSFEVPLGSGNLVSARPSLLEAPDMYAATTWYDWETDSFVPAGGVNSRLGVPLSLRLAAKTGLLGAPSRKLLASEKLAVNFKTGIFSRGYYLFVILPQVSFDPPSLPAGLRGLQSGR